ncbi:hypothetical protein P4K96_29820, partial [Bacillus cereus]|nr:hypothetical protein [Bacillus cereus]
MDHEVYGESVPGPDTEGVMEAAVLQGAAGAERDLSIGTTEGVAQKDTAVAEDRLVDVGGIYIIRASLLEKSSGMM